MYLWRGRVDGARLNAEEILQSAPGRVAITQVPGRKRVMVKVCCRSRAEAAVWVRRFGGGAERLAADWVEKYLAAPGHAPLRIGRQLIVVSARAPQGSGRWRGAGRGALPNELVIPAAGAFGTGEHATTAMSLRLLEEVSRGFSLGWKLLDLGTGTGILALAARRFGAGVAVGLDNDPRAVAHARTNARANKISGAEFFVADVLRWKSRARFDVVTANLFSELLILSVPLLARCLTKSGQLILSGILREQAGEVIDSLGKASFRLEKMRRRGKWVALLATLRMDRTCGEFTKRQ